MVLDTPSKHLLWAFLLPRMSQDHRNYVLRYVDMSVQQINGISSCDCVFLIINSHYGSLY